MATPPSRNIAPSRGRNRRTFISRPAMKAISTTARPLMSCSSRAIWRVMMFSRYGPQIMPKSR
jgi:hypothetical protein